MLLGSLADEIRHTEDLVFVSDLPLHEYALFGGPLCRGVEGLICSLIK